MSIVEQYWQGVAQRLQIESGVFNRLIEHNGESGIQNELSLASVVSRLLPPTVGVGSGIIFDSEGRRSKQTDMILFDQSKQPNILAQTTQMLYPVETVLMAIEVKTTVTTDEVADAGVKAQTIRELQSKEPSSSPVPVGLFGYQCGKSTGAVVADLRNMDQAVAPDLSCVLMPGIYGSRAQGVRAGIVALHQTDEAGEVISGAWERPPEGQAETIQVGSTTYPITALKPYGQELVVGNPGRALLLFCADLLSILGTNAGIKSGWLEHYLPASAREMIETDTLA